MTDITKETIKLINDALSIKELAKDYCTPLELEDMNELYGWKDFDASGVQVIAHTTIHDDDENNERLVFQVSDTYDCGACSSRMSLNSDNGGLQTLENSLLKKGISEDFLDEYLWEIAALLAVELDVQAVADDYWAEFGHWEPMPNAMDGNSQIFILKGDEKRT